jgi:hypothetical protein
VVATLRRVTSALVVLALVAFGVRPEGSLAGAAPSLDVEVAGCRVIERGPICELPKDGVLRALRRTRRRCRAAPRCASGCRWTRTGS